MDEEADLPIPDWPGLAGRRITLARADKLVDRSLRDIYGWWQSSRRGELPSMQDFDITEHARTAPHLYIAAEVEAGYELRLAGEEYIRLFGYKKGWVWRRDSGDPLMRDSAVAFDWVGQTKHALHSIGRLLLSERDWVELEALVCPLAPDADRTRRVLGCVAALPTAVRGG